MMQAPRVTPAALTSSSADVPANPRSVNSRSPASSKAVLVARDRSS